MSTKDEIRVCRKCGNVQSPNGCLYHTKDCPVINTL